MAFNYSAKCTLRNNRFSTSDHHMKYETNDFFFLLITPLREDYSIYIKYLLSPKSIKKNKIQLHFVESFNLLHVIHLTVG